jgi:hypothetical protein
LFETHLFPLAAFIPMTVFPYNCRGAAKTGWPNTETGTANAATSLETPIHQIKNKNSRSNRKPAPAGKPPSRELTDQNPSGGGRAKVWNHFRALPFGWP